MNFAGTTRKHLGKECRSGTNQSGIPVVILAVFSLEALMPEGNSRTIRHIHHGDFVNGAPNGVLSLSAARPTNNR